MGNLNFTVIICTKDRRADVARCLDSLAAELPRPNWDVLVIDNASTDDTSEFVRDQAAKYPVTLRVIYEEQAGLSYARNRGLIESNSQYVIFVDDDVSFHSGWCQAFEECAQSYSCAAAGGTIIPVFPDEVPSWYVKGVMADGGTTTGNYQPSKVAAAITEGGLIGHPRGGNMLLDRQLVIDLGSFRVDLGWGKKRIPAEETELFKRIHASGGVVRFTPKATVNHHLDAGRMNLPYLRKWHIGYGRASILMRPPKNQLRWLFKFVEQIFNIIFYSLRLHLPGGQRNFRAHRKQRQSLGRVMQMLGL